MNIVRLKINTKVRNKLSSQLAVEINGTSYIYLSEQKRVTSIFKSIQALKNFH